MKRTELRRKTPMPRAGWTARRAPMRRISAAKRRDLKLGADARRLVINRDRHCVMCPNPISDVHHRLPRGAGGAMGDPTRWALSRLVGLCRAHHRWVEEHRTMAGAIGLLIARGVTAPDDAPVQHHGVPVLLFDDGSMRRVHPAAWPS